MKILRYSMLAVLTLSMSCIAHAAGFSWNLQDPPTGPGFFDITNIGQPPFTFMFENCNFTNSDGTVTYLGCAEGQNQTGQTLTSFTFTFENEFGGVTPDCTSSNTTGGPTLAIVSCGVDPDDSNQYLISYACQTTGCGVAPNAFINIFESAENGLDFPEVTGVAGAATPEPDSIWLALSGMGSLGYLVRRRRRATSH